MAGKAPEKMVRVGEPADHSAIYYSENGGSQWKAIDQPSPDDRKGWCAISAEGSIMVWSPEGKTPFYTTDRGNRWNPLPGIDQPHARVFADYALDNVFYVNVGGQLTTLQYDHKSDSFKKVSEMSLQQAVYRLTVVPGIAGEIWVARNGKGITRISNAQTDHPERTDLPLCNVTCIGVGKGKTDKAYPALYIWGRPAASDPVGLYRSDDQAKSWTRINDDQHQFGGPGNGQFVKGDMNHYGTVYMGTFGRGVIVGEIKP
jgi:photosystem II stability/assembly factor-like uncharacterized protein